MTEITIDLRDPASFFWWTDVTIRFSDQDPNAHVNNTAFPVYCEAGRVDYLKAVRTHLDIKARSVLASVTVDYVNQLYYPGVVCVGTRLTRVGGKSFTLSQGLFAQGTKKDGLVATSTAVLVGFNYQEDRTLPLPDIMRDALADGRPLTSKG
ncbi:MAG: thioesterase family protein [Rhodospirillaceae bacterium]